MLLFLLRIMLQNNKKLVILDEPTASLDHKTSNKMINMIIEVAKKQTTLIITHDQKLSNIVDRVITL